MCISVPSVPLKKKKLDLPLPHCDSHQEIDHGRNISIFPFSGTPFQHILSIELSATSLSTTHPVY